MSTKKTSRAKATILPPAPMVVAATIPELTARQKRTQYMMLYMRNYRAKKKAARLDFLAKKRAYARAWYIANREAHIENVLAWRARNPEKYQEIQTAYRTRVRKARAKLGSIQTVDAKR